MMRRLKFSAGICRRAVRIETPAAVPAVSAISPEAALWAAYQADPGPATINALVLFHEPFIRSMAKKFFYRIRVRTIALDDLVQEAMIAAVDCIRRFESARKLRFTTFAGPRIRGAMLDWMRHEDHVPRLDRQRGIEGKKIVSINTMAFEDEANGRPVCWKDTMQAPPPSPYDEDWWRHALRGLSQNQRLILIGYYRQHQTMKVIGQGMGISESRVSQMHSQIVDRLQKNGGRLKERLCA